MLAREDKVRSRKASREKFTQERDGGGGERNLHRLYDLIGCILSRGTRMTQEQHKSGKFETRVPHLMKTKRANCRADLNVVGRVLRFLSSMLCPVYILSFPYIE